MRERNYTVIAQCYLSLRAVAQSNRRSQVRQLLLSCDIKTVNTVVLITEIGRRYRKAKFKRRILHPERVLLEWSDFVYLGGTKENAIAYLTKKRDFLSSFIYGLERLTYPRSARIRLIGRLPKRYSLFSKISLINGLINSSLCL